MAYVAVVKALYDYAAQDPETELSLKEDAICYVIEKEDEDWWKAKLKDENGQEGPIGLIPSTYVEELPPMNTTRALYAYDSTSPEELSMMEDESFFVYSLEDDWLLVCPESSPDSKLGFVPRTYCQPLDEASAVDVPDADEAEAELEQHRQEEEDLERAREVAEKQRVLKLKDKVETWSISEMEGRKKKKGTLGVGNGAVFFASDSDKMGGVKQYNITELSEVSQPSSKTLELVFASLSQPLLFHCGSRSNVSAIVAKLETSKEAAGEVLELTRVASHGATTEEEDYDAAPEPSYARSPAAAESKTVRWAADSSASGANGGETATVLYDFDAQGDDELTVQENETVTVIDKENDEWWSVRNAAGQEGVVPAQYVQLGEGGSEAYADDGEEERRHQEDEAAAAAALEAERQREASNKAEERRAIERAARERQKQEEEDRKYAEELEQKEAAKAERRARRQQEEQRSQREYEMAKRREAARGLEPPKIAKRPSAQDVGEVARSLPTRGKQAPIKPPEKNRPKPAPGRTRLWSDKSGQFKVEAEYLGLNGNKIRLHKMNGVIIEVPIEKMSQEDVQLIRRHEARKARALEDEDDIPLGRQRSHNERSEETKGRSSQFMDSLPREALEAPKPRKPRYDWFAFFLEAGCDMDDCTRYASNFERAAIDEEILPDLDAATIRNLGLKEGDVIRVRKIITGRYAKKTPEQEAQIKQDEDYAKALQEHENSGSKGPIPQPPPSLFTSADGKLANNTRRGRPEKKSAGPETVDPAALAGISEQLTGVNISSPSPPPSPKAPSPPPAQEKKSVISGFDDDAWTIKPSASKPASPAPPPAPAAPAAPPIAAPAPTNPTESLLLQIQSMRPSSTGISSNTTGGSGNFDKYAAMVGQPQQRGPMQQTQTGSSAGYSNGLVPTATGYGLGVQGSNQSMGQMQNSNGPRGPVAPVPANETLLNPLQPVQTGFVPTRGGGGMGMGMQSQQTGFMPPQQTGMMPQQTGFAGGFQQGYGGQQQQMQPNFTGYPGNLPQQSQTSNFNQIASMRPPEPAQPAQDKFAPSNIFAAMKESGFGKPEEQQPQASEKYDSLRPLTTGYNGGPGGGMMSQPTGMGMGMQQTGMGMGGMPMQQTGMGMQGMGGMQQQQQPGMQYPGYMMGQMTGFNPQQQGGFGYGQNGQGYR